MDTLPFERRFDRAREAAYLGAIRRGAAVFVVVAALAVGVCWTAWTDQVKARSPLGTLLTTSQPAQRRHNFGTLEQRFSPALWDTIAERIQEIL